MKAGFKSSDEKKRKIRETLQLTREKRKSQVVKVYTLKVDESHLNILQKQWIHRIFLEAKWFYNYAIGRDDLFSLDLKIKNVLVKNRDGTDEWRKLELLSSQMKLGLYSRIINSIKGLSILKKKGFQVGRVKHTRNIDSIPLPQFKNTWNIQHGRIRIQGLKKTLPVSGLDQIPEEAEFANAILFKKASGYYLHVTTYLPKQERVKTGKDVGLDFGIKDSIVTSDGEKFNVKIPESEKLKNLQRRFSKKAKGSKQRRKVNLKIRKEYEKITNQKKDKVNKIVSHLVKNYDTIYIQDEMIKQWQSGLFGKQVQNSALGAIKARLKSLESVRVISRSFPTTKMCYNCGTINPISLSERVYRCDCCGLEEDRDIKAAKTILTVGRRKFPYTERICTPPEMETSIQSESGFGLNKFLSMKEEAVKSLVSR
jgi:transposase